MRTKVVGMVRMAITKREEVRRRTAGMRKRLNRVPIKEMQNYVTT